MKPEQTAGNEYVRVKEIIRDKDFMELSAHGTEEFPIQFCTGIYNDFEQGHIDWHWHKEFEIAVVTQGGARYYVEDVCYSLRAGDGIIINSNSLHMSESFAKTLETSMLTIVMDAEFIAPVKSVIYQKCIQKIMGDPWLKCVPLKQDVPWQRDIIQIVLRTYDEYREGAEGAELRIHCLMCEIWQHLLRHTEDLERSNFTRAARTTQIRLRQMLTYIQKHYSEKIALEQIAAAANISKSECLNCFQKGLGISPVNYAVNYRLEQAIHLLITTDKPILEIANLCGFESASYFGKAFRGKTGLSPKEYRRQFCAGDYSA